MLQSLKEGATTAQAGPGHSQEFRTPSMSPTRVAGTQAFGPFFAALPGALAGSWIEAE